MNNVYMREFAEHGDAIVSTEIAQAMGMHPWEIAANPEYTAKFNEIVEFMAPYEDKTFLIQKLTRGKTKDQAVDHIFRYVGLRKDHIATREKFEALEKELRRYE